MDTPETRSKARTVDPSPTPMKGTCQVCGRSGGVVYDPEKAPPNRLCYRCAAEYGLQDPYDDQ
jgi:uncharacterized protein (DUF983 family)